MTSEKIWGYLDTEYAEWEAAFYDEGGYLYLDHITQNGYVIPEEQVTEHVMLLLAESAKESRYES